MTAAPPTPPPPGDRDEEAAWAALRARWDDPGAHRDFLDRLGDLDGLARAGARYRAAIAAAPGDAMAIAGRDEVVRKATLLGLTAIPRTEPPAPVSPWVKRAIVAAVVVVLLGLAASVVAGLLRSRVAG